MFKLDLNRAARPLQVLRALITSAMLAVVAVPAVAFHFPWDQGHDTTNSNDPPPPGPCGTPECDPCNEGGTRSPVYAATGHCFWSDTDVVLRGRPYLGVSRSFNSNDPVSGLFGNGWTIDFDIALYPSTRGTTRLRIFKAPNGKRFEYTRNADQGGPTNPIGTYTPPASRFEQVVETAQGVTMTSLDGTRHLFALDGRLLERIDPNGNRVQFSYDSALRPVRMADLNGRSLNIAYNASSRIDTVTDHTGRVWRYGYDVAGNLLSVTDPLLGVLRYQYTAYRPTGDAFSYSLLTRVTDPSNVELVAFTYANGRVTAYNEGANTFTYTRPASNTTLAGTVTVTDRLGARNIFVYGAQGLVTRDTDGLNFVRTYTYDANGRRLTEVDERGGTWTSTYDSLGRTLTRTNPLGETTTMGYTGAEPRPVQFTSPTGRITRLQYGATGNLTALTDALGAVTRMDWNAAGDPISVTDAMGGTSTTTYNAVGLPTGTADALGRTTTYEYDSLGRVTRRTNAAGESSTYGYDVLDRITSVTDALNNTVTLVYDAASRILSVTDQKGSTTTMSYDGFGRLATETAPDGRVTTYAYRLDNLLDRVTNPDGTVLSYLYDANKRLTRQTAGSDVINYTYNARGELTQSSGTGGTVSYTYDNAGRVLTETSNGRTITSTRNAEGERVQFSLQSGGTTQYTRDARGLITEVTAGPGTFTFTRDALGRRTRLGLPNGSAASYAFDAAGQLQSLSHDGAFNAEYQYNYDPAGRILGIAGAEAGWTYAYDQLGRVTSANRPTESRAYVYDAVGNLQGNGAQHDVNHRLVSDSAKTYTYDDRGNLTLEVDRTSGARVAYTWNVRNQLTQVQFFPSATAAANRTLSFTYDPMGRRSTKTDGGVQLRYVYDGFDLVATLNASNATLSTTTFGSEIDDPLVTVGPTGARFYHTDHQGSVAALSGDSAVTTRLSYDPYGSTTTTGEAPAASFAYTGREKDADDLYYFRSRYYSPSKQRFLSEDGIGLAGGLNPYAYVDGDPVNATDPTGECPFCVAAAIQYARCVATCSAISAAANALTGGCADAGDILGDCATDCLNPLNWGGKGAAKASARASARAGRNMASGANRPIKVGPNDGVIYRVPGNATGSGKPYIGRSDDLAQRTRNGRDGRDRSQAEVIGTYPKGDVNAARRAEQQAINDNGGVPNLDNRRNEIAPSKWPDYGVK
jgi:RHS repeat-associated protein